MHGLHTLPSDLFHSDRGLEGVIYIIAVKVIITTGS